MVTTTPATKRRVRLPRIAIVGIAVVAALVVFAVASLLTTVRTPAMNGMPVQSLNAGFVVAVSAVASLLGWGLLALLEKLSASGRTIWRVITVVVLALSLGGPFSGSGITTGNRLWLAAMHVAVGLVLIALLPGAGRKAGA
jgi:hypothetical protein